MVFWVAAMMVCPSDDLEIALQFPIGDVLAELALLPLAGRSPVIDESLAEQVGRGLRLAQALRRLPERARQIELRRVLHIIRIADDRRHRLDLVLDAVEAGADGD